MSYKDDINLFIDTKITDTTIEQVLSDGFGRYSKYIIQERALPDVRDGLKPVQRRILYGMNQMGVFSNKPYKKSARIVGEVMGKYHPHGDSSIYEAMVRLAQDFKMLVPLCDMHGNYGSIDGDSPAAMRYTETRLSKAAEVMLNDLDKRTVSFVPNFDDQELEPTVLPAKFPNLLVNGSYGIAAGYATKIPPHNLSEVINATIYLLKNPNATLSKIMQYLKGPDFPTGGIVQGRDEIINAFQTGIGKVVLRSKVIFKEIETGPQIIITEIPYEVNKALLVRSIDQFRVDGILEDILEVRDETDQNGMQIAIDLKKGADQNVILNYLYKNTELQVYYNYNMVCIIDNKPKQVGVIPILKAYISHQKDVITNRTNYLLEKAEKRKHIVEGLVKMVSVLDEVIKLIRQSVNKTNAKELLMQTFDFSELQAEAIVMLQLYRLSTTDIEELKAELIQLEKEIREYNLILHDENELITVIESELRDVQGLLGKKRKTILEDKVEQIKIDEKELISNEQVMVAVSKEGYITRSTIRSFMSTKIPGLKQNDSFIFKKECSTLDILVAFTSCGNYLYIPVYKLDDQKFGDLGTFIGNIVAIKPNEKIIKVLTFNGFNTKQVLLLSTKKAMMKQINLSDLSAVRFSKPIKAISLSRGDELISVDINAKPNILAISQKGYILRFKTAELPIYGLQASGVKSMLLQNDDTLAGAIYSSEEDDFMLLTNRGHIIREKSIEIPIYNRYRKGSMFVEPLKQSPHIFISITNITKEMEKANSAIWLITDKITYETCIKDLKYQSNKYGKKVLNAEDGMPLFIVSDKSKDTKAYIIKSEKSEDIKKEEIKKHERIIKKHEEILFQTKSLTDEIISKDKKEIKLTKFGLFDDEEE